MDKRVALGHGGKQTLLHVNLIGVVAITAEGKGNTPYLARIKTVFDKIGNQITSLDPRLKQIGFGLRAESAVGRVGEWIVHHLWLACGFLRRFLRLDFLAHHGFSLPKGSGNELLQTGTLFGFLLIDNLVGFRLLGYRVLLSFDCSGKTFVLCFDAGYHLRLDFFQVVEFVLNLGGRDLVSFDVRFELLNQRAQSPYGELAALARLKQEAVGYVHALED